MERPFGQRELWFVALSLANLVETRSAMRAPLAATANTPSMSGLLAECCALTEQSDRQPCAVRV